MKSSKMKTFTLTQVDDPDYVNPADPRNVNGRLYDAMATLLDNFEDMSVREQVATLSAIARIQILFPKIRESAYVHGKSGTTVRKYEKTFQTNAGRRRKSIAGPDDDAAALLAAIDGRDDEDELEH